MNMNMKHKKGPTSTSQEIASLYSLNINKKPKKDEELPKITFKSSNFISECSNIRNLIKQSVDNVNDVLRRTSNSKEPIFKKPFTKEKVNIVSSGKGIIQDTKSSKKNNKFGLGLGSSNSFFRKKNQISQTTNNFNINIVDNKNRKKSTQSTTSNHTAKSNTNRSKDTIEFNINEVNPLIIPKLNEVKDTKQINPVTQSVNNLPVLEDKTAFNELVEFLYCSLSPNLDEQNKIKQNEELFKKIIANINDSINLFKSFKYFLFNK